MQIQLTQVEITKALRLYITQQGINLANKEVAVSFTAGRGATGISADINIADDDDVEQVVSTPAQAVPEDTAQPTMSSVDEAVVTVDKTSSLFV